MNEIEERTHCPVCFGTELENLLQIEDLPAHCNLFWREREQAISAPHGNLELAFCHTCGHIFNRDFDQSLMEYTELYENTLDFSPVFQSYAQNLAEYLVEKYDLHQKNVIDIGCGKGEFLKLLVRIGNNRGIGFDPSYESQDGDQDYADQLTFIKDFYSPKHASYQAEFIYSRHVLEHIETPRQFISMIRAAIGEDQKTALYFEVPNALYTFCDQGIWDLIYEHPSYFSPSSLTYLFMISGFENIHITSRYQGQFLGLEADPGGDVSSMPVLNVTEARISSCISNFRQRYQYKIGLWRDRLSEMNSMNQNVLLWGAGSKGVTFLNLFKGEIRVDCIVDINPRKHGKFVSGTGSTVISPAELKGHSPDHIILMNPVYEQEIREMVVDLGMDPEFWTA